MDKKLKNLVKMWQMKAENDLQTSENEFKAEKTVTDAICFHSQQAVEKYLKSWTEKLEISLYEMRLRNQSF